MKNMNVGLLKKLIENLPDDTIIVVPSKDHSYRQVDRIETTEAERGKGGYLGEWYEDQEILESSKIITVLRIE